MCQVLLRNQSRLIPKMTRNIQLRLQCAGQVHRSHTQQQVVHSRDHRLPPRLNLILPSSELLRGVSWCKTDVSVLPTGPIFKGQAVLLLKMGPIGSPETSVLNQLTPCNNPEDGRIRQYIQLQLTFKGHMAVKPSHSSFPFCGKYDLPSPFIYTLSAYYN